MSSYTLDRDNKSTEDSDALRKLRQYRTTIAGQKFSQIIRQSD